MRFACPVMVAAAVAGLTGCGAAAQTVTVTSTASQSLTAAGTSSTTPAATTSRTSQLPYSGIAPNANVGPATDQSLCPGIQATVGPDTSCSFAKNVETIAGDADQATGHFPASLTAFSPVTGKTYGLRCSIHGYGSELVCGTLPPATGVVVLSLNATPPTTSTATPPSAVEGAGSFSHATDAQFCSTHTCIETFPNGNGYIVQCVDGEWSHSGGLSGACSDHGGEG